MKSETGVKDFSRTPPPASLVPLVLSGPLCPAGISPPRGESPLSGEAYLPTPCEIKSPTCIRKRLNINITDTGKGNNRRWQVPGGQRGQRANSAGRFRHGCTRKLLSSGKPAERCGHRLLLNAVSHPSGCFLILSLRRGYFCGVGAVFRIRISFRSPAVGRV